MRVIRSCGPINNKLEERMREEEVLRRSWDYWERNGLTHPSKRAMFGIKPLKPNPRKVK